MEYHEQPDVELAHIAHTVAPAKPVSRLFVFPRLLILPFLGILLTLKQVGLYLTHGIQHHTNRNNIPVPQKDSDPHRNISLEEQENREYNDGEEDRSGRSIAS